MLRVLVSNIMMLKERERFESLLRSRGYEAVWASPDQFLSEDECLDLVGDIDGWLCGDDRISRTVLEAALPKLKVISKWGTGIDSIDTDAARDLGVPVCNSPAAFAQPVAEVAFFMMLALSRHLVTIDRSVRAGQWIKPQGRELAGQRLAIVGFGAIGRRIAEMASGAGMEIIFSDPAIDDEVELPLTTARPVQFGDLPEQADVICLACNYSAKNHHMIDAEFLSRMKAEALLINVARGPLVDEDALAKALGAGTLAGAGLDVFEQEPISSDSALLKMDNVVLGTHNANNARGAVEFVHQNTLDNLDKFLAAKG